MEIKEKKDQLVEAILYNPHVCDFIWQRSDGTYYTDRRDHGQEYRNVQRINDKWVFGSLIDASETNHY